MLEVLRKYQKEMKERLRHPKTPFDTLRLLNLINKAKRGR